MPTPYRPRHRRSRAAHNASDVLLQILLVACLLGAALTLGGLLAGPFSPFG